MKKYFYWMLAGLSAFFPLLAWAAGNNTSPNDLNILTPSAGDLSITYLQQLFGTVGGILHSTHGQILGHMFSLINAGVIAVMGMIIAYGFITFVLNAANDGDVMSRGKNTAMMAIRIATGLSLAVPSKTTGYCIAQSIIMWAVIQGVGLADTVWSRVLNYLQHEGGQIYVSNPISSQNAVLLFHDTAELVFKNQFCLEQRRLLAAEQQKKQESAQQSLSETLGSVDSIGNKNALPKWGTSINRSKNYMNFGSLNPKYNSKDPNSDQYLDECGQVSWASVMTQSYSDKKDTVGDRYKNNQNQPYYMELAVQQMVNDVQPIAKIMARTPLPYSQSIEAQRSAAIVSAIMDYSNFIRPLMTQVEENTKSDLDEHFEKARHQGWAVAGSYYRTIADVNKKADINYKAFQLVINENNPESGRGALSEEQKDTLDQARANIEKMSQSLNEELKKMKDDPREYARGGASGVQQKMSNAFNSGDRNNDEIDMYGTHTHALSNNDFNRLNTGIMGATTAIAGSIVLGTASLGTPVAIMVGGIGALFSGLITSWSHYLNSKTDPLIGLQAFGYMMMFAGFALWMLVMITVTGGTAVAGTCSAVQGAAFGLAEGLKYFNSLAGTLIAMMFVGGVIYSIYIPLIPFLIFTFAVIGWLITVLEAMVAAPLVALGLTHPEGHDLLSKAEQALILMLSVFLRPVLLLVGLITAMILAQISMRILNAGFSTVVASTKITQLSVGGGANLFGVVGLMIIYTLIVVYLINNAFNVIPLLAEKIMRWIGGHPENVGYESALHQIQGGIESGAKRGSDMGVQGIAEPGVARFGEFAGSQYKKGQETKMQGGTSNGSASAGGAGAGAAGGAGSK